MIISTERLTLADYLAFHDETDNRYELIDGVLCPVSLGTGQHTAIIRFISRQFDQQPESIHNDWVAIPGMIGVRSPRGTRWDTVRIPDITLLPAAQLKALASQECIIDLHAPRPCSW